MSERPFAQVDVFSEQRAGGNPVAVVLEADGLSHDDMQRFANWTNLSETTFVSAPTHPEADYAVRIFTPDRELPFAGHPTLGSCHAWLEAGGTPKTDGQVVQECPAGLITIQRGERLAFAAPPLVRSGPVEDDVLAEILRALSITRADVVDSQWVDNGPGWVAVLVGSAEKALAIKPGDTHLDIGVVGLHPDGRPEIRGLFPANGIVCEDPVTGSLNASVAEWLLRTGRVMAPYVAHQGTVLGRTGRIYIDQDDDGTIWVGGATTTLVRGTAAPDD